MNLFWLRIKENRFFLISLFLLSLAIRFLVFHFYLDKSGASFEHWETNKKYWQIDSNTYHKIAVDIAENKGISVNDEPNFYRLPGYSIFLSLYYKLFGIDTKKALLVQIFLASFIPILIFLLSLVLFPSFVLLAKISSLYSVFHLGLVLYSGFFMTESLFIFLFLLFCILFFSSFHFFFCIRDIKTFYYRFLACDEDICSGPGFQELTQKIEVESEKEYKIFTLNKLFFAGIFLGLASLVRPVGHYLIFLSILMLIFSRGLFKDKIKKCITLFIAWLIPTSIWLIRNYMLLGQLFFHTLPGGHFLYFSATRVAMQPLNANYYQARKIIENELVDLVKKEEKDLGRNVNEIEYCNIRMNLAVKYFLKYPIITVKHWLKDILRTTLSLYSSELVFIESGRKAPEYFSKKHTIWTMFKRHLFPKTKNMFLKFLIYFEIVTFFLILLGFLLSLIYSFLNGIFCSWFKVLPFICLFLIVSLAGGYSRMRLPIEPFFIIFSFSFWIYLFKRKNLKVISD